MTVIQDPVKVMDDLKNGNLRFTQGTSIHSSDSSLKKLKDLALAGQFPKAIILCCSDSRAPVEIIFDQDIGDLFVIRVAGNIIAPSLVGSVEYAASTFGIQYVLVMGHSQCGAIRATLNHISKIETVSSENLRDIVGRIKPHIFSIASAKESTFEDKLVKSVEANVRASVAQLATSSRLIEDLVQKGKMRIDGAVMNLENGVVEFLEM
jgi:carbonic anhydrase